jgi:hypothetical protein
MNAYTLVGPTKRYPSDFSCLANASAYGVDLGRSARDRGARLGDLVRLRELRETRRRGRHSAGVVDGGLDLAAVADDRGVLYQPVDVPSVIAATYPGKRYEDWVLDDPAGLQSRSGSRV